MNDDVIAYQLGELAEMQAVRKRGPMIDRDRLREALEWHDRLGRAGMLNVDPRIEAVVEAARLVADPDTLIVWWCEEHETNRRVTVDYPPKPGAGDWCLWREGIEESEYRPLTIKPCRMVERALLAQQTGDTK